MGHNTPKKFVIVSIPRTGSSVLQQNLNGHPEILMHGEVFHPDWHEHLSKEILPMIDIRKRESSPMQFLEQVFGSPFGRRAVGFKIFEGHDNTTLLALLMDPSVRKILLRRDNYLANYSSLLISVALNYWNDTDPSGVVTHQVAFDPEAFQAFVQYYEECYTNWRKCITNNWNQTFLEVTYRPDDGMMEAAQAVAEYLELDPALVRPCQYKKLNTPNIVDRFTNPEEVEAFLATIGRLDWAEER